MSKHELILASIANHKWAITEEGISKILAIASQGAKAASMKEGFESLKLSGQDQISKVTSINGSVATVNLSGPIFPKANLMTDFSGATSLQSFMSEFAAMDADEDIDNIIIYADTPGGVVTGITEAASMISASKTPVTFYVTGSAASAGYWLAAAADEIVVSPTAYVGSIGVVTSRYKTDEDSNVLEFVSSQSPKKRINPETKEGATEILNELNSIAEVFISSVASGRGVSEETVAKDFGQGGGLIGQYAVDAGMADSVGTYEGLLAKLNNNDTTEGDAAMPKVKDLTAADIEKENPDLFASIKRVGAKARETEVAALETKVEDLSSKLAGKDEDIATMEGRVKNLEQNEAKREAKRELQAIAMKADKIVAGKLASSDIPESFHGKVKGYIKFANHVTEGVLDEDSFSAAVDAEVKDWTSNFESTQNTMPTTLGMSVDDVDDDESEQTTANDEAVTRMLGHCGYGGDE